MVAERLYRVFQFDLDVAAGTPPNVSARIHYGATDDGLFKPCFGYGKAPAPGSISVNAKLRAAGHKWWSRCFLPEWAHDGGVRTSWVRLP